jgi:hypothetical protein
VAIVAGPVLMLSLNPIARRQQGAGVDFACRRTRAPALPLLERQSPTPPLNFEDGIRSGDLDVVLEVDAAFADDVGEGRPGTVRLA